ncbi:hypothetical protein SAMN06265784_1234 [Paraburkholderia susongensis]|uniref:Uncharacterized protein n=1 Tax=Paraburkholderia susongensis TaxID=1515439 RepID=A0A1X7M660_9BURK|nr:hypothetical protein SAMN06265784_1234 [Paraburkholderia susongensis]
MHILATPMRQQGRAIPKRDVEAAPPVRGDLLVTQEKSETFGRYSTVARFQTSGAAEQQPLPPLHDADLSWMGTNGFVLTGIEVVGGVTYAQSWWCRLRP